MIDTASDLETQEQIGHTARADTARAGGAIAAAEDARPARTHERPSRLPVTLYRVQLHQGFTFDDARALVPYLAQLGVTDLYASPILTAARGSTHGYDISDHGALNPELGGDAAHARLSRTLADHRLGHLLDIVPNHMAADPVRNVWWRDVLENGPSSPYARYFDVDWTPVKPELTDKVLLPILGDQYGAVLERGELRLGFEQGALTLTAYGDRQLPTNPQQSVALLRHDLERLREQHGDDDAHVREFLSILTALQNLPPAGERDPDKVAERHREKEVARDRLARLVEASPAVRAHIDTAIAAWNGVPGDPRSFDRLHALLEAQCYRLAYWRTASDEINYRRFFDVNDLAGIRMEDEAVFDATHALVLRLVAEGRVTGLRVDHPDGLYDPIAYAERLQDRVRQIHGASASPGGPGFASGAESETALATQRRPLYIAIEKILSAHESLPDPWPVYGTTTYSFLNAVNGLFVDTTNAKSMRRIYARLTGRNDSFATLMYQGKKLIILTSLASEMNVLSHALNDLSESSRTSRDFTLNGLRKALMEVIACFPVYRTYVSARGASDADRAVIRLAVARAKRRNPAMERSIFDFIERVLLPPAPLGDAPEEERADRGPWAEGPSDSRSSLAEPGTECVAERVGFQRRLAFAMRFQQYTGPVHAKGVEDTAFYRYHPLVSLNEVGGDPERFGLTATEFHDANRARLTHWPYEMIGTATHDTKRGEDARARIDVLSEMPDEWRHAVGRWMRTNASARTTIDGEHAPDRNDEYLYYQALIGAWPAEPLDAPIPAGVPEEFVDRLQRYMQKAIKEAKIHSSWVNEHQPYEQALANFVSRTLRGASARGFLQAFLPFQRRVARLGALNSLGQLALKLCSPGVVDLYQGTELWDLTLVDPDNRRPVDFDLRRTALEDLSHIVSDDATVDARETAVAHLLDTWTDGRIKLLLTMALLRQRREQPDLFLDGDYLPLPGADAPSDRHLVAFARQLGSRAIIVMAPRFTSQLAPAAAADTGGGSAHDAQRADGTHAADGTGNGRAQRWPVGFDPWRTMRVQLPESLAGRTFTHLLTGASVRPLVTGREASLPAADVFKSFPLAVLIAHEP
jgi:(1->4)-alpha-D-glucan 1-alpha-D-glucosylmutase